MDVTQGTPSLIYQGWLSPMVAMGILICVSIFIIFFYLKQLSGEKSKLKVLTIIALRCSSIALILWILLGQAKLEVSESKDKQKIGVFIDVSQSMTILDEPSKVSDGFFWGDGPDANSSLMALEVASGKIASILLQLTKGRGAWGLSKDMLEEVIDDLKTIQDMKIKQDGHRRELDNLKAYLNDSVIPIAHEALTQIDDPFTFQSNIKHLIQNIKHFHHRLMNHQNQVNVLNKPQKGLKNQRSRIQLIDHWLNHNEVGWVDHTTSHADLTFYKFSDSMTSLAQLENDGIEVSNTSKGTDLNLLLNKINDKYNNQELDAAIVITDGNHSLADAPLKIPENIKEVPLFILPIGNKESNIDIWMNDIKVPTKSLVEHKINIDVDAVITGLEGQSTNLNLTINQQLIESRKVIVDEQQMTIRETFEWVPKEKGHLLIKVTFDPLDHEKSHSNNEMSKTTLVIDDEVSLFLADEFPRWETRYLKNLFDRDEKINVDFMLLQNNQKHHQIKFPGSKNEWQKYDLVILGDINSGRLNEAQITGLVEYVEMGGVLFIQSGKNFMPSTYFETPLAKILPIKYMPLSKTLSHDGAKLVSTKDMAKFQGISELSIQQFESVSQEYPFYISPFSILKENAHSAFDAVDKSGDQQYRRSYLSMMKYGSGSVFYFAAPQSYQLRYRYGDRYHYSFWGELIRWASSKNIGASDQRVRLYSEKSNYDKNETPELIIKNKSEKDNYQFSKYDKVYAFKNGVLVSQSEAQLSSPNTKKALFKNLPEGELTFGLSEEFASNDENLVWKLHINKKVSDEMKFTHTNMVNLKTISEKGNGLLLNSPKSIQTLLLESDFEIKSTTHRKLTTTWDKSWLFFLLIFMVCSEWALRKHMGLI